MVINEEKYCECSTCGYSWIRGESGAHICSNYMIKKESESDKFEKYKRKGLSEMRPYITGEDITKISIADVDDPDSDMGMVARNPNNHKDQWYVSRKYFNENLELVKNVETNKLYWYLMVFLDTVDNQTVHYSTIVGMKDHLVTINCIKSTRCDAGIDKDALLLNCDYLGFATHEEMQEESS